MTKRDIALVYLSCFCAGDIEGLVPLLAEDLCFRGTLHTFQSATDYLDSLRDNPPVVCDFTVVSITENRDSVAMFYELTKPNHPLSVAQLFRFREDKICEVLLIFDSRDAS